MKNNIYKWTLLGIVSLCVSACTVYEDPAPYFEDNDKIESPSQRKILLITVDGLVGEELKKQVPTNLTSLMAKSKYTFSSLSDEMSNAASTWTTMMTGVSSSVHKVEDDTFRAKPDPARPHAPIAFTPSMFYRLFFTRPEYNTTIITPWEDLAKKLLIEMETQVVTETDLIVRDSAVAELQNRDPEILIVNFQDVENAGKNGGYTMENPDYVAAVNEVDNYIGNIMSALEQREDYNEEEWLVVVTSNKGGSPNGGSGTDSNADRNTFTLIHYKDFSGEEIIPTLIGGSNFTQFAQTNGAYVANVAQAEDGNQYNFVGEEMSVEFKMKKNIHINHVTQAFVIGKTSRENSSGSGIGWGVATANSRMLFYITFDDGVKYEYNYSVDINDLNWHHFAFSLKKTSAKAVQITLFNDGIVANTATITTTGAINGTMTTNAPLFVGVKRGHNDGVAAREDLLFADLRIYNKAMVSQDANRLSCLINDLPASDPLFGNQLGSYKLDYIDNNIIYNDVAGKTNLRFTTNKISKSPLSLITTKCNEDNRNNIWIKNEDMIPMIFYWLRLKPEASWGYRGINIIDRYESEIVKINN